MRVRAAFLVILVALVLLGCEEQVPGESDEGAAQTLRERIASEISIDVDFQHYDAKGRQKVVIWIANSGSSFFSGTLRVRVEDRHTGKPRGRESFQIEQLKPGCKGYVILWLKANSGTSSKGTYAWVNCSFTD